MPDGPFRSEIFQGPSSQKLLGAAVAVQACRDRGTEPASKDNISGSDADELIRRPVVLPKKSKLQVTARVSRGMLRLSRIS